MHSSVVSYAISTINMQAAEHWELALAVNPLHPDGWFALGHCEMKRPRPASNGLPDTEHQDGGTAHEAEASAEELPAEEGDEIEDADTPKLQGGDERALQAFTRCVHQAPDHGQAWNNIAALHLKVAHPVEWSA